jgi:hypothetical protein
MVDDVTAPWWIELEGAVNVRDLGGRPTVDGRADNLQGLTSNDVRTLIDRHGLRAIADLRSEVEVDSEGPGPLTREPLVERRHLSLLPEAGRTTDAAKADGGPVILPWQTRNTTLTPQERRQGTAGVYRRYLADRPESVVGALRLIAFTDGATIVHCAAGKDRTGVVVAFALTEVGVPAEEVVADYAATAERIQAIFARLLASRTYRDDLEVKDYAKHAPRAESMANLLELVDAEHGGVGAWLRAQGWTEDDAAALRKHLLDD